MITPAGAPLDAAATMVGIAPGAVKHVSVGCANGEQLVDSWSAIAFASPVDPALASGIRITHVVERGQVRVTMSASEALPRMPHAFVQVGVRCSK
jgi:hypothetical protein